MKEIIVVSGKGGTGKTVITGAFAAVANNKIMVDCDVDAADLHLLLHPKIEEEQQFKSGFTAYIDQEKCIKCGKCQQLCRFNAIKDVFVIDPISCEGCCFCSHICPVGAIHMHENISGAWYISKTNYGSLVHAKLGIAEENSGKLVIHIRQQARILAAKQHADWIIVDGPPGIGCPVIAAITGANIVLIVAEPTLSGLHDVKRIIELAQGFKVTIKLVINKYNLNEEMAEVIEQYAVENGVPVIGKIEFTKDVVAAVVAGKTIMDSGNDNLKKTLKNIWQQLIE